MLKPGAQQILQQVKAKPKDQSKAEKQWKIAAPATQVYTHATFEQMKEAYEAAHPRSRK